MLSCLILLLLHSTVEPLDVFINAISQSVDLSTLKDYSDKDDAIGKVAQVILRVITDVQDRYNQLEQKIEKRTKALEESKAKDEAIIKNIAEGLVVTDLERRIIFINTTAEMMLGYRLFELFEKKWPDFLEVKDHNQAVLEETRYPINLALSQREPVKRDISSHYYYKRKDGSQFPVVSSAAPIMVGEDMVGAVVVFRDVSKEVEVDKVKTEFVSLASHQLRTPLSTINWYTETLLSGDAGDLEPDQIPYFEQIYESTQRMINLVNALLNVSRLEMGTFMVEPEPINVTELITDVIKESQPKIDEKHIELINVFDEELPPVLLDPQLMWIIVQNLITNAVKYTPESGSVTIRVTRQDAGDKVEGANIIEDSVVIEVTDTGYGIPSYQQDQIFSKLFRADNVREKETEGTGLGLYIIKSILEHVGGKIWFISELNKGSSFFMCLPLSGMKHREGTKALSAGNYN